LYLIIIENKRNLNKKNMPCGYNLEDDEYYDPYGIAKMHDDMLDAGVIDDSGAFIKTDREVLDDMDTTVI